MFDTLLPEKSILPAHPWANMAGRRNKNAFTFVLKLLIISQMQILDVKDVVCLFCLIWFFTSTQQSFSYAGRFFLGLTSTKLG